MSRAWRSLPSVVAAAAGNAARSSPWCDRGTARFGDLGRCVGLEGVIARPAASPTDLPEQFGRCGMVADYPAHDTPLDRRVALKVPFFHAADGPQAVQRSEREAKAAARRRRTTPNSARLSDPARRRQGPTEGDHKGPVRLDERGGP